MTNLDHLPPGTRLLLEKLRRLWNGEPQLAFEIFAPSFINYTAWKTLGTGPQGIHDLVVNMRKTFPDLAVTIDDVIVQDHKVAARAGFVGTHLGPYGDLPATGRRATWSANGIYYVVDGRFTEEWSIANEVLLLEQLGLSPRTPAIAAIR